LIPGLFGILVQGILFSVSIAVLVFKKYNEQRTSPMTARTWPVFLMDSSKQLAGAGWIHFLNLVVAKMFGEKFEGDGCNWYWINIVVDTTLGVLINFYLLKGLTLVFEAASGNTGMFESGDYKDDNGKVIKSRYFAQFAVWILVVSIMKCCMVLLMTVFHSELQKISSSVLDAVDSDANLELIVVMVLTPCCMNAFQLWVQDTFIKSKKKQAPMLPLEEAVPSWQHQQDDNELQRLAQEESKVFLPRCC